MDNSILIQKLTGNSEEFGSSIFDCYVRDDFGVFIPIFDNQDSQSLNHKHPSYEIIINFEKDSDKPKHYWAEITSPDVVHNRNQCMHCYSIFIEKEYFENRFYKNKEVQGSGTGAVQHHFYNNFLFGGLKVMHSDMVQMKCDNGLVALWLYYSRFAPSCQAEKCKKIWNFLHEFRCSAGALAKL